MRAVMFSAVLTLVGCASQPAQPPNAMTAQAPVGSTAAGGNIGVTSSDIEAQRLAAAKNLNLKVLAKDGQQLFCRSNYVTGSHIQRDTRCYTADQLDQLQKANEREVDTFLNRPDTTNPSKLH